MADKAEKIQKAIDLELIMLAFCAAMFSFGGLFQISEIAAAGIIGGIVMAIVLLITYFIRATTVDSN